MNVLILDDEQLIRENVYRQVMSVDLGIDQVLLADSAQKARRMMQESKIDIFLCDIVMPEEDGIAFAKWTLQRYPKSKFIFLTAHSDYKYMKEAISLQSFDYILQPAPVEELQNVLTRAIMQIRLEEKNRKLLENASFLIDNDQDILEALGSKYIGGCKQNREFFDRYIQQTIGNMDAEDLFFPFYLKSLLPDSAQEERPLIRSMYKSMIDEIAEPLSMRSVVFLDDTHMPNALVIFRCTPSKADLDSVLRALETIRIMCLKLMNRSVVIYASVFCTYDAIADTVAGIMDKMEKIVRDVSCICLTGADADCSNKDMLSSQVDAWRLLINMNRIKDFQAQLMDYLNLRTAGKQISKEFLGKLHQQVSEIILKKIITSGMNTDEVFDADLPYSDFMYCTKDLDMFIRVINMILNRLSEKLETKERDPIDETIRYIRDNIDRDVSVRELADMVGVTTEYFSRLFKKKTGMNLKKYIVNEKMKAAKILLSTTDLSVTTISDRVGYNSYSNFSYTFKSLFDESPKEYRNRYRQSKNN